MKITQISVFLENRAGRLAEVTRILGECDINIRALSLADTSDFGILRLIVDKTDEALKALREKGFTASLTDVIAVEVEDRPGGLADILAVLQKGGINVEYMYAFVEKVSDRALLVFRFEDPMGAVKILQSQDVRVVGDKEIRNL